MKSWKSQNIYFPTSLPFLMTLDEKLTATEWVFVDGKYRRFHFYISSLNTFNAVTDGHQKQPLRWFLLLMQSTSLWRCSESPRATSNWLIRVCLSFLPVSQTDMTWGRRWRAHRAKRTATWTGWTFCRRPSSRRRRWRRRSATTACTTTR